MPIILDGTTGITTPGITNTGTFVFQGPVQVPAGTVGAPSVTTDGDTNTGIYFPAADTIGFAEGGVEALRINSSAQIAVNTAGTAGAPVITKTDDLNTGIFFPAADTIAFSEGGVEALRINSSGNVGIGTSSPTDTDGFGRVLDIQSTGGGQVAIRDSDNTTKFARLAFDGGTTNAAYVGAEGSGTSVLFRAGAATRATLDSSGNLGLGVTPSAWDTAEFRPVEMGTIGNFVAGYVGSSVAYIGSNAYYNGGWKYARSSVEAAHIDIGGGAFRFKTAGTGTAGNAITWTQAMTLDSGGSLGIGTTSPLARLDVSRGSSGVVLNLNGVNAYDAETGINFSEGRAKISGFLNTTGGTPGTSLRFYTMPDGGSVTERARITSGGALLIQKTTTDFNAVGAEFSSGGFNGLTTDNAVTLVINRKTSDGDLIAFRQDNTTEGTISVSGNTVSYNAFAGSHWSQLQDGSKPDILRGTVMESINELCEWPDETNERLPKAKVSDTAGSKKVYGVFMAWDNDWTETNDMYVTAVGAFICRVNGSITVQEGDLLESNGDGTARVQADDIIRSSTIGKVTSTVKTHEYDDGSYCVPTVLYCG